MCFALCLSPLQSSVIDKYSQTLFIITKSDTRVARRLSVHTGLEGNVLVHE